MLRLLWDLCLFRRGPQDIPYSVALASGLLLAYAGAGLLHQSAAGGGNAGLRQLALSLLVSVAVPWALLRLRGREARYVQVLCALVGTGILATLAFLPLAWLASDFPAPDPKAVPTRLQFGVATGMLILAAWKLAINGHIWKHALDWPLGAGIATALGVFVIEIGLLRMAL